MGFVGNIIARVGANINPLQQNLSNAQRNLQQFQSNANRSLLMFGASAGVAQVAFSKLAQVAGEAWSMMTSGAIKAYNEVESSNIGLKSILDAQGKSFVDAQSFIKNYISDGLIPLADATTAFKTLSVAGYSVGQTKQILTSLKNASVFGRQASMTMGEAVRSASEGIKNENSILVNYLPSQSVMMAA
jgi:hypothetical protein